MSRVALSPDYGQPVDPTPRKPLTEAQRIEIWNRQNGLCGRTGCGKAIPHKGPGVIDEHLIPLAFGKEDANDLKWRALFCTDCATVKTAKDLAEIGHVRRMRAKHEGTAPPPLQKIKSRGFQKRWGEA